MSDPFAKLRSNSPDLPFSASVRPVRAPVAVEASIPAAKNRTDEQDAVIRSSQKLLVVEAVPGSGKTHTLVKYAEERPEGGGLYLAYNRAMKIEAETKLRHVPNFRAMTAHAVAYASLGHQYRDLITNTFRPWDLVRAYSTDNRTAGVAVRALANFFNSTDESVKEKHINEQDLLTIRAGDVGRVIDLAVRAWNDMVEKRLPISPDAYLKMWALTKPSIEADYILFDEAQDANPLLLDIVLSQRNATRVFVGDRHQAIYGFRGAINAMQLLGGHVDPMHLTNSWRFPQRIADVANQLLAGLLGHHVQIRGCGKDAPADTGAPSAFLSRTNAALFAKAAELRGHGIHWVGGLEGYRVQRLVDVYSLYANDRSKINDPFVREFPSWHAINEYAKASGDVDVAIMVKLVEEYGHDTPDIVKAIQDNAVAEMGQESCTHIFSTAHKAKGLEFQRVEIAEDFSTCADTVDDIANGYEVDDQEVNLLFVALTRAQRELALNSDTSRWIETALNKPAEGRRGF